MRLDWITDPHFDHLRSDTDLLRVIDELHHRESEALLVTGDIAESSSIHDFLGLMSGAYQRPIYFVLGNHDYYGTWMEHTQKRVRAVCGAVPPGILNWMPESGTEFLDPTLAIVGCDGLYDAREGQAGIDMSMADFYFPHGIYDFADALSHGVGHLFHELEMLARTGAEHVVSSAEKAISEGARKILVLTHVPPFLEASYFRGKPSDVRSRPWYVNKTLGEALVQLAERNPDVYFVALAGHTHGERSVHIRDNLLVRVAPARYGSRPKFVSLDTDELTSGRSGRPSG